MIEYLLPKLRGLEAVQAAKASVSDGWPAQRADAMVVLGLNPDQDSSGIAWAYSSLGGEETEQVVMPCVIVVHRAGPEAAPTARRDAFAILDDIRALVAADRRFGGAIDAGTTARITRAVMAPTARAKQAGQGRVVEVNWWLEWAHRLG